MAERLLEVNDLKVQFATEDGTVRAVDGLSFELERGKVLGIVALRCFTSDSTWVSSKGPPCDLANAGIMEPTFPEAIQVRQWSGLVG